MAQRAKSETRTEVQVVVEGENRTRYDSLATEEPMEIRLLAGNSQETLAVTMRTPGSDFELAAGFLYGEGILSTPRDIGTISYCTDPSVDEEQLFNIVNVLLRAPALPDLRALERHFYTSSACGVCGKASLDSLELRGCTAVGAGPTVKGPTLHELPARLRSAQGIFEHTGGLHAGGLFDKEGNLVALREDVGRHNAVDKLVGWALLNDKLPLDEHILMVSGRASYEILQKAVAARIPIVCAVSAPSSLAVATADRFGITLVGFLRDARYNVYTGSERILL
ncbi:MAG: formate dehydrogenase accessory sulfurtransferase FdhD [Actinomycetota bacterium]|nr:formate dehydrogenase accessory sulfurtransferase FdhD [Actinomycetota bacterium]